MNKEAIIELSAEAKEDVVFAQEISEQIVSATAADLDNIMLKVKEEVVDAVNKDDQAIVNHLLNLTNALYFINTKIDNFGFFDDITKANALLAYNAKYAESQMAAAAAGKKLTQADHQQYAEKNSIDEKMLNLIYARSAKALKNKIDGGYAMVDTLKRILKYRETESFYDKQNRKLYE